MMHPNVAKVALLTTTSTDRISRARQRLEAKLINRLGWESFREMRPQLQELENACRMAKGIAPLPPLDTTPKTDHVCPEPAWGIPPKRWAKMTPAQRREAQLPFVAGGN